MPRNKRNQYEWKGRCYDSASFVNSFISSPGLERWQRGIAIDYAREHPAAERWVVEKELVRIRNEAADRGTGVHVVLELLARGEKVSPDAIPEDARPYLAPLLAWFEEAKPEFLALGGNTRASELEVYNSDFGVAGRLDALVRLPAAIVRAAGATGPIQDPWTGLFDLKTKEAIGKAELYGSHSRQLAVYRHAQFYVQGLDGVEHAMPPLDGGLILFVAPDGCRLVDVPCGDAEFEEALCALTVARAERVRERARENGRPRKAKGER